MQLQGRIWDQARLLAVKTEGLFKGELLYGIREYDGSSKSFFADEESWDAPFGVRVTVVEADSCSPRILVKLPNDNGYAVVHVTELTPLESRP